MVTEVRPLAPDGLEAVQALLNTWLVPNDTRVGTDVLTELSSRPRRWRETLPDLPRPGSGVQLEELRHIRDRLRVAVEDPTKPSELASWLSAAVERHEVTVTPLAGPAGLTAHVRPKDPADACAVVLASVLAALQSGRWERMKACRDCRWVFYDHSRSGTKIWCGMNATGPNGRACGSIAKVRAYRSRQALGPSPRPAAERP